MKFSGQILRFASVGLINTLIGMALILGGMALGLDPFLANALGYAVGFGVSFLLNRIWTFRSRAPWQDQIGPFLGVMLVAYGVNFGLLNVLIDPLGVNAYLAQVGSVAAYAVVGFLGMHQVVYAELSPPARHRRIWALLAVLAGMFWIGVWWQLADSPLTRVLLIDERYYMDRAHEISQGRWAPDGAFYMSPLYPYLLWITGSARQLDAHGVLPGPPPLGIRILQAILWCGVVVLIARISRRLLTPGLSWIPPALFVLYRVPALMAANHLLEVPYLFCTVAVLHAAIFGLPSRRSWLVAAMVGILLGLAVLLRGVALVLLAPLVVGWIQQRGSWRQGLAHGALSAACAALIMLPASIHNSRVAGRPAGPSMNSGIVLYAGNGPQADGYQATGSDFTFEQDPSGAGWLRAATGRVAEGPAAIDRAWREESLKVMTGDPRRTLGLWAKKVRLHFMAGEIPNVTPLHAWGRHSRLLSVLILPFGLLSALGLAGLILGGWRAGPTRILLVAITVLVFVQSWFFVVSRYRQILVPLLVIFAGIGVQEVVKRGRRGLLLGIVVLGLSVLAVQPWGETDTLDKLRATAMVGEGTRWQALGNTAQVRGDGEEARADYRRSIAPLQSGVELWPHRHGFRRLFRSQVSVGDIAAARQTIAEGIAALEGADQLELKRESALLDLQLKEEKRALTTIEDIVARAPDDMAMRHWQVVLLSRAGRAAEAVAAARAMVAQDPGDLQAHRDLGRVLLLAGQAEAARQALERGLSLFPGDAELRALRAEVR